MFARFLEMTIKPETKLELIKAIKDEIIPIFKSYKGFFDVIHLEIETDPAKLVAVSLWHDRMDLEKYTKQDFPKIKAILDPFLTAPLVVRHCTVNEAISMKFATAVAARSACRPPDAPVLRPGLFRTRAAQLIKLYTQ